MYVRQTRAEGNSIWTVDVDGENATQIVKEVGLASPNGAFWTPDGKQIAVILFDWELDETSGCCVLFPQVVGVTEVRGWIF